MEQKAVPKQTELAWERQFAELQEAMREMKQEMMSHRRPTYFSNCPPNRVAQPAGQYHGQKATDQSRCQERTEHCQQPKRCPEGNCGDNFRRKWTGPVEDVLNVEIQDMWLGNVGNPAIQQSQKKKVLK